MYLQYQAHFISLYYKTFVYHIKSTKLQMLSFLKVLLLEVYTYQVAFYIYSISFFYIYTYKVFHYVITLTLCRVGRFNLSLCIS